MHNNSIRGNSWPHVIFIITIAVSVSLLLFPVSESFGQTPLNAREITKRMDLLLRGDTNYGLYEMRITDPNWTRSLRLRSWEKRTDKKSFIRILSPRKEKGVGTLRINTEMWNYLPRVERIIKIPPSMMMQSWMGSDFTNDDLVKESSIVEDYFHRVLGEEKLRGFDTYRVELLPKPDAPVVWGKIILWIKKGDYIPLRQEYYTERGDLVRVLVFSDIKELGGRIIPAHWEMHNLRKKGKRTVLRILEITFNLPIPDSVFTLRNLKKVR